MLQLILNLHIIYAVIYLANKDIKYGHHNNGKDILYISYVHTLYQNKLFVRTLDKLRRFFTNNIPKTQTFQPTYEGTDFPRLLQCKNNNCITTTRPYFTVNDMTAPQQWSKRILSLWWATVSFINSSLSIISSRTWAYQKLLLDVCVSVFFPPVCFDSVLKML